MPRTRVTHYVPLYRGKLARWDGDVLNYAVSDEPARGYRKLDAVKRLIAESRKFDDMENWGDYDYTTIEI